MIGCLFDQLPRGFAVSCQDRMMNCVLQVALVAKPRPSQPVKVLPMIEISTLQHGGQGYAQERVQSIPGLFLAIRNAFDEQVLGLHARPCAAALPVRSGCSDSAAHSAALTVSQMEALTSNWSLSGSRRRSTSRSK